MFPSHDQRGANLSGSTVSNSAVAADASAIVWDDTGDPGGELDNMTFIKGSTANHAIEFGLNSPTTLSLVGHTYTGYNASNAQNDSTLHFKRTSGTVTVNISGGGNTPSYRTDGATIVINNNTQVTFTGMKDNTEVRVYDAGDDSEIAGIENATAGSTDNRSFAWTDAASNVVNYVIHNETWETIRVEGYTVPATDASIPIQQRFDRNYSNP